MDANALYKKLKRSLLCEILLTFLPFLSLFFLFNVEHGSNGDVDFFGLIFAFLVPFFILIVVSSIIKIIVTIKAMNACVNYFSQNHNIEFEKKCKTARIIYILSYIIPFIPYLNFLTIFLSIYLLIMWFIVRNKVKDIKLNNPSEYEYIVTASGDSESKTPMGLLIGGGIFLAIIIFGGLISAVALPAYYKYVSKARYQEVIYVADFLKKQVELCMLDLGTVDFAPNQPKIVDTTINPLGCSNLKKNSGKGWRLVEPKAVRTLYVKDVVVDVNGVITAYGGSTHGLDGATYQLVPHNGDKDDGTIIWKRNDEGSTCVHLNLC